jgi:glycosyltransferase involved in cell wall biosynthesis
MPTHNRRAFLPAAVHFFLRQHYVAKELIVVDDGTDAVDDLIPPHSPIRYHRLGRKHNLGSKRNLACEMARGSIIVHWDDDDWMAPWRIGYQVRQLLASQADICGCDRLLFYDPQSEQAWQYVYPDNNRPWVAGGTLCYLKSFWKGNPFAEIDVGEDGQFVWGSHEKRIHTLARNDFYIAIKHTGNTSPKKPDLPLWQPLPTDRVRALLGDDLAIYDGGLPKAPQRMQTNTSSFTASRARVTVSLPCYQCQPFIRRAVESILAQSYMDFRLIVINDGDPDPPWEALADIDDPRLVRFDLASNRGRYFADAVALAATTDPYFMIQDADDWSAPHRMATLLQHLRAEHAAGAVSAHVRHNPDAGTKGHTERHTDVNRPLTPTFEHRANHQGLYRTEALRAIGGYFSGFRIGYDTLLVNLLLMTGRLAYVDEALYYRTIRTDSLSGSAATGMQSPQRQQVARELEQLYSEALGAYHAYVAGEFGHADLCRRIQAISARHVTAEDRSRFEKETRRLREQLNATRIPKPAARMKVAPAPSDALIDDPRLDWSGWAIGKPMAHELQHYLEGTRPGCILELGSGTSTIVLAAYASRHRARLVSLSHESAVFDRTDRLLRAFDLRSCVDLRLAALEPYPCPNGRSYPFYGTELKGAFDFVLIDGPPLSKGREATFFAVATLLAPEWTVWLHDGSRDHEQSCVSMWAHYHMFQKELAYPEPRGLYTLKAPKSLACHARPGAGTGIGILTGGRLNLLQQTIANLRQQYPSLLEDHFVAVLVNGHDPATRGYLKRQSFVDLLLEHPGSILPIGDATSRLMQVLLQENVDTVLHLEDDWACSLKDASWLKEAQAILENYEDVGQVRLRHVGEQVLPYHMVTRRPITWEQRNGFLKAQSAHFTFNPSLVRARDVSRIFPCRSEHEAQINFLRMGRASVQLLPGVFHHSGANRSRPLN